MWSVVIVAAAGFIKTAFAHGCLLLSLSPRSFFFFFFPATTLYSHRSLGQTETSILQVHQSSCYACRTARFLNVPALALWIRLRYSVTAHLSWGRWRKVYAWSFATFFSGSYLCVNYTVGCGLKSRAPMPLLVDAHIFHIHFSWGGTMYEAWSIWVNVHRWFPTWDALAGF